MLILNDKKFIKTNFDNEEELEQVVVNNFEYIFGPSSIYLPKKLIKTLDGFGTIPDGFVIDISSKKWYIVEAELLHHNVWNHIAPQISKQLIAVQQKISKKIIADLAVEEFQNNESTKEKFLEQGIKEINVRKVLDEILDHNPVVGIPIDSISNDLKEWARTLRYSVKLWEIKKYVEFGFTNNTLYEFPEEFKPELDTEAESEDNVKTDLKYYDVSILDLIEAKFISVGETLEMNYKPKNGSRKKYTATVLAEGNLEVLGQKYSSPSYAALAGIQNAGSERKTVNGWTSWKNQNGQLLTDLREKYLQLKTTPD